MSILRLYNPERPNRTLISSFLFLNQGWSSSNSPSILIYEQEDDGFFTINFLIKGHYVLFHQRIQPQSDCIL